MAGYKRRPIYTFDDENAVGLNKIPNGAMVVVKSYNGETKQFVKNDADGVLAEDTTIASAIADTSVVKETGASGTYYESAREIAVADQLTAFDDRVTQVDSIVIDTVLDATEYKVTVDNVDYVITSPDADTVVADIRDGLIAEVNNSTSVAATVDGDNITVTAKVPGVAFTLTEADDNLTVSSVVANFAGTAKYTAGAVEVAVNNEVVKADVSSGVYVALETALSADDIITIRTSGKFEVYNKQQADSKVNEAVTAGLATIEFPEVVVPEGVYAVEAVAVAVADQTVVFDDRVAQVDTVVVGTVADDTTYSITIDGSDPLSYTSETDATLADIRDNLVTTIDGYAGVSAVADGDNIKVTADAAGTGFTIADQTEVTSSTTIANYTGSVKYQVGSVVAVNGSIVEADTSTGVYVVLTNATADGDIVEVREVEKFEVMSKTQVEDKINSTSAKLLQTVATETVYQDDTNGKYYKVYMSDGNFTVEEVAAPEGAE